jgi:integrase/recombinase XerD
MKALIQEFMTHISVERGLAKNTLLAYGRDLQKYAEYLASLRIVSPEKISRDKITK